MNDLLSAASLFLAVLGLLYSAWYAEINECLKTTTPQFKRDRGPLISRVEIAYYKRARPLAVGAVAVSLILFPDLLRTLWSSYRVYRGQGFCAIKSYDAVRTLFCSIWAMTFVFARHALLLAKKLKTQLAELNGPDI
jgi:hypothetical protein